MIGGNHNVSAPQRMFGRFADAAPVGDVIPFFDDGAYHLFCLTPPDGSMYFPERLRVTWRHLRSADLVHWEELPEALAPGGDGDPDSDGIWTGSVIRAGGELHIFYTGHTLEGDIPQSVCHATSADGITWVKDPANPVSVPDLARFEGKDWRDPFVFWNQAEQRYWMLLTARSAAHPAVSRGVIVMQTSADLLTWSEPAEFYETFLTHAPECPEIFPLDGRWVLGYSRFTDRRGTVYRVADSPRGPWHHLATEGPDGANWYAAKSLTDAAGRRIAFGWVPDRNPEPSATTGRWLWAGDLAVPRQLALAGGRLAMTAPAELDASLGAAVSYAPAYGTGKWSGSAGCYEVTATGGFGYCVLHPEQAAAEYVFAATVAAEAAVFGLAVQTSEQLDRGAAVLCYPAERRVCAVDLAALRSEIANEYEKATTEYASVAEGCLPSGDDGAVAIRVVVRSDVVEAFVAGTVCLTYRLPAGEAGSVALLIQDGSARFTNVRGQLVGHIG
ncbi:MAG TPA: family 43 glycosylhydrolase [Streptosporangiaceae bacterium]|jgi:beta-fructofuranosidase